MSPALAEPLRRRHPLLWKLGAGLVVIGACWFVYVVAFAGLADNRVRSAMAELGLVVEQVDARSWYPGHLTLRNLVVQHSLLDGSCRTFVKEVLVAHDPWGLLQDELRIGTLRANGVELSCSDGPVPVANRLGTFELGASNISVVDQRVELEEVWANLVPATTTWQGQTNADGVAASLRGSLVWQSSRLAPDSRIALEVNPGRWNDGTAAHLVFEQEGTLRVDAIPEPQRASAMLRWQANLPMIRYEGTGATTIDAREVELLGETESLLRPGQSAHFRLQAKALSAKRAGQQLTAASVSVAGELGETYADPLIESARLTLTAAQLHNFSAGGERYAGSAEPIAHRPTFFARADVRAVGKPVGYTGSLDVQGDDADVILELGRKADLPEWIRSKFTGEPFSLVAILGLRGDVIRLDDIDVVRGAIRLKGWWQGGTSGNKGAMLMQYGGLAVGLDLAQSEQVVLPANQDWLESTTPAALVLPESVQ